MRSVWLWVFAALTAAACTFVPPESRQVYRDPQGPISSTTRFRADRFAGDWVRVAAFDPATAAAPCQSLRFDETPTGMSMTACDGPPAAYRVLANGRLEPSGDSTGDPLWILWTDDQFRTAVIGTPSGRMGWILNRTVAISADRLKAARTILDFNGYALSGLRPIP